jgi:hypothetical protein
MYAVRDHDLLVPVGGEAPVYEGLRVGVPSPWNPDKVQLVEFGRIDGTEVGVREAGTATWNAQPIDKVAALNLAPEHFDPTWPEGEEAEAHQAAEARIDAALRYGGNWAAIGWLTASDGWLERAWARHGQRITQRLAQASSWYADQQRVPVVVRGGLRVARGIQIGQPDVFVLPPTLAGWRQFLDLAPATGLKFTELEEAGTYWWNRKIPRNLLSAAREGQAEAA